MARHGGAASRKPLRPKRSRMPGAPIPGAWRRPAPPSRIPGPFAERRHPGAAISPVGSRIVMSNRLGMHPRAPVPVDDPGRTLFDGLPVPACLVDGDGRLVALNRGAVAFYGVEPGAVVGRLAMPALAIVPADGREGDAWARLSPPGARRRLRCRVTGRDGQLRVGSVIYAALEATDPPLGVLFLIEGTAAGVLGDLARVGPAGSRLGLGQPAVLGAAGNRLRRQSGAPETRTGRRDGRACSGSSCRWGSSSTRWPTSS